MDEAAPPEAGDAAEKKQPPLLRRVPTSLVVTLVGIALTAWLLPAFTRQWDDRQKAQQLKAAIVADMASATARALIGGEAIWRGQRRDQTKVLDAWAVASLELETRLRTYVGARFVTTWQIYSWLITRFDDSHMATAEEALITATRVPIHLGGRAADAISEVVWVGEHEEWSGPHFDAAPLMNFEQRAVDNLHRYLRPYLKKHAPVASGIRFGPNTAEGALLALQAEVAREVLGAHVAGYSTTAHDFFHDLIP